MGIITPDKYCCLSNVLIKFIDFKFKYYQNMGGSRNGFKISKCGNKGLKDFHKGTTCKLLFF